MRESELAHEPLELNARGVMWFGLGLALSLALISVIAWTYLHFLTRAYPSAAGGARNMDPQVAVPPPQLQSDSSRDLAELRAREDAILQSYGWVDRKAGRIRIPIDRAIELTAERGLPARKSQPPAAK
jgi:hypothetical protein